MTICLGVLCTDGKKVVVTADRMLTGGDVEFEQDIRKIDLATESCVMLSAGSALQHVELVRKVKDDVQAKRSPSIIDVVDKLKQKFVEIRRERAEELYLKPIGMNFEQFYQLQTQLPEPLMLRLTANIEREELGLELLVAGVDNTGGHLYYIHDPGIADCFDAIGFCAIGSGERHAELTFIRSAYSPKVSLNRAVFLAYQAKRDSELAPGVGDRFTDMAVIDESGIHFVHEETLEVLREAYKKLMSAHSIGHTEIEAEIDRLILKWS
ncbi:MAG: hypothetical protein HY669_04760 [Chloroflexi bacterium]|nr:hypothetical protein [Chloroflexota bacterium]